MSFGSTTVVGNAFRLAKRNLFKVIGLYFIFGLGAVLLAGLIASFGGGYVQSGMNGLVAMPAASSPVILVLSFLPNLVMLAAGLSALSLLTMDAAGRPISFASAIGRGLRQTPVAIVISLLLSLVLAIAFVLPLGGLSLLLGQQSPAVGLAAIALIPFVLWINAVLLPIFPALVAEQRGLSSISRAIDLTRGHRWPIVGALFLMGLAMLAVVIAGGLLMTLLMGTSLEAPQAAGGALLLMSVLYAAMAAVVMTLGTSFQAGVYNRLVECQNAD